MNVFNQSKARCRKLAWMREIDIYPWFIMHTDWMRDLMPRNNPVTAVGGPEFKLMQTNFGNNQNEQNCSPH